MYAFSPPFIKKQMCDSTLLFSKVNLCGGTQTRFVSNKACYSISLLAGIFFLHNREVGLNLQHTVVCNTAPVAGSHFRLGHCLGIFRPNFTRNLLCVGISSSAFLSFDAAGLIFLKVAYTNECVEELISICYCSCLKAWSSFCWFQGSASVPGYWRS